MEKDKEKITSKANLESTIFAEHPELKCAPSEHKSGVLSFF